MKCAQLGPRGRALDVISTQLRALTGETVVSANSAVQGLNEAASVAAAFIAATGDDDEDARVAAIARALGVPVNVPDKPALCSFVMPAIVDRGEVTVAR